MKGTKSQPLAVDQAAEQGQETHGPREFPLSISTQSSQAPKLQRGTFLKTLARSSSPLKQLKQVRRLNTQLFQSRAHAY
jgi:hypothetical protein